MMDAWTSFAKTGDPNHVNLPEWATYDLEKRSKMIFDSEIEIWNNLLSKEREMWNSMKLWSNF